MAVTVTYSNTKISCNSSNVFPLPPLPSHSVSYLLLAPIQVCLPASLLSPSHLSMHAAHIFSLFVSLLICALLLHFFSISAQPSIHLFLSVHQPAPSAHFLSSASPPDNKQGSAMLRYAGSPPCYTPRM